MALVPTDADVAQPVSEESRGAVSRARWPPEPGTGSKVRRRTCSIRTGPSAGSESSRWLWRRHSTHSSVIA